MRVKSFHFYLSESKSEPERHVHDYSPEEQAKIFQQFAPLAARYRRYFRVRLAIIAVAALILIISLIRDQKVTGWTFGSFFSIWLTALLGEFTFPIPKCPACQNDLERIGEHCPECGAVALSRATWFTSPRCGDCSKLIRRTRGRKYKIHCCSHCGIWLDDKGL